MKASGQVWTLAACLLTFAFSANGRSVSACAVLPAQTAANDTLRIQAALNRCSPGKAVVLQGKSFQSGPLILPRGVTLFVDRGTTLYASTNPRVYDLQPGSCGRPLAGKAPNCKPFLYSYQAAYSGVQGNGVIDGQGASWRGETAPELVSSYESTGFTIAGVTLRNAAGIHAAIYKTIAFLLSDVRIESAEPSSSGAGLLLSNAVDPTITGAWIRVPAKAIVLKASILGPTTGAKLSDIHIFGGAGIFLGDDRYGDIHGITFDRVSIDHARAAFAFNLKGAEGGTPKNIRYERVCLRQVPPPAASIPDALKPATLPASCANPPYSAMPTTAFTFDAGAIVRPGNSRTLTVHPGESIQQAIDALPLTGGDITVKPGTYREVLTLRKPHVHLHGDDPDPARTTIVYNHGAANSGGTFNTATVFVEADDVTLDHLSLVNDLGPGKGQGVALHVVGDRATFRHLRISAAQDTLFAASRYCYGDYGPCETARQYFADCFIEGNIDFIFGDSKAVFERCELHGIPNGSVMYTAQSKHTPGQDSGYIFDRCRFTGVARNAEISLGRSWRPYATVVLLNAQIDAPVVPEGWTEWLRLGVPTLPTAYYAEYNSLGQGANPGAREKYSHQLTEEQAKRWSPAKFLQGPDGWTPQAGN